MSLRGATSATKQSILDLAMPSHGLLRWRSQLTNATSPRLRGEVGDGAKQSLRVRGSPRESEPCFRTRQRPARRHVRVESRFPLPSKTLYGAAATLPWVNVD